MVEDNDEFINVDPGAFTVTVESREDGEAVGVYAYDVKVSITDNYVLTENVTVTASLTITKKELVLTSATDTFIFDGQEKTRPAVVVEGLAWNDTYEGLKAIGSITTPGSVENPIDYDAAVFTSVNGEIDKNYDVKVVIGTLTVLAKGLVVEFAAANATALEKTYGDADAALEDVAAILQAVVSEQLEAQGLEGDDVVVTVNGRADGETVNGSPYAYDVSYTVKAGLTYDFEKPIVLKADLVINKRPITIAAASADKVYNNVPLTNNSFDVSAGTLAAGESIKSVDVKGSQTHVLRDDQGNVIGSPNVASGAVIIGADDEIVTENYAITYVDGVLTIKPAPLEITVQDQTVRQGSPIPKRFDLAAIRFLGTDGPDVLGGAAEYQTDYTPAARAGESFEVDVDGFTANDYEIVYIPGLINVVAANGGTPVTETEAPTNEGGGTTTGGGTTGGTTEGTTGSGTDAYVDEGQPVEVTTFINGMETPLAGVVVPIEALRPPLANIMAWALMNLILTLVAVLIVAALLLTALKNRKKENEYEEYDEDPDHEMQKAKKHMGLRLLSVVAAVIAVLLFIFTQDMSQPMIFIDPLTIWHLAIVAVTVLLAWFSRKKYEEDDEDLEKQAI